MWFVLAFTTAICWGFGYALSDRVLEQGVAPSFFLLLICMAQVPTFLAVSYFMGAAKPSLEVLSKSPETLKFVILSIVVFVIGNLCVFKAVQLKNATYVNLIEITYPIFTVLFTYVLFKTVHLNAFSIAGGLFILCGALLVVWKG